MNYIQRIEEKQEVIEKIEEIERSQSLTLIICAGLRLALYLAVEIIQQILRKRAEKPTEWPNCPVCGRRLRSKGLVRREIMSIIGLIQWKRRAGRCPNRCEIGQVAPLDAELGLTPYQSSSVELCQVACLLAIFVPYQTASTILARLCGVKVSAITIWNWVQEFGKEAISRLK